MLNFSPTLVLNADYQPLSYYPLSLWSWQDSVKAVFLNRVNIVAEYDQVINSPTFSLKLPSVIALKEYISTKKDPAFTRFNVFLRDKFLCQYCSKSFKVEELTFDHVIPKSKGGKTTWDNVVTSCRVCNTLKGNKSLKKIGVKLKSNPYTPNNFELKEIGRLFPPNFLHQSWNDFLYWDSELEP